MKIPRLFNMNKDGKGVPKPKQFKEDYSFLNFFHIYGRKFWKLLTLNVMFILINFPIFFGLAALSGKFDIHFATPRDPLYAVLHGAELLGARGPEFLAQWGAVGMNETGSVPSTTTIVLYCLFALVLFTFGWGNAGMAYVLRNFAREEHASPGEDFLHAVKKNFWQGLLLGFIDLLFCFFLAYDILFFRANLGSFVLNMGFYVSLLLALIYVVMRFYLYILLVTFKLGTWKILKNSYIFALLGIKRNLAALFGIALTLLVNFIIYFYFLPIGGLLPFIITISTVSFISVYAAYPVIKKHMIDPYYGNTKKEPESDSIFTDTI